MSNSNSPGAPNVRIIPPLIYLAGLAIGFLVNIWMPLKFVPDALGWLIGAVLIICGVLVAGSALLVLKEARTTVRPDRAATALVIRGPYRISRNPMYLALASVYLGIAIAGQSIWALILLPVVLAIIQLRAIRPEEAFLKRRFGADYVSYTTKVRRWL
jgi:protein-S-isoprenylcysteine O-methyltransferase Ste14